MKYAGKFTEYTDLKYLSSGSFGCVFLHETYDEKAAIKIMRPEDTDIHIIVREIIALSLVQKDQFSSAWNHWIQLRKYGRYLRELKDMKIEEKCANLDRNGWFIETDFAGSETLDKFESALSAKDIQDVAFQLLWASLNAYKEKRLLHNDLKNANITIGDRFTTDPIYYKLNDDVFEMTKDSKMIILLDTGSAWVQCSEFSMMTVPEYVSTRIFRPWETSTSSNHGIEFDLFSIGMVLVSIALAFRLPGYKKRELPPLHKASKTWGLSGEDQIGRAHTFLIMRDIGVNFDEDNIKASSAKVVWNKVKNLPSLYDVYHPHLLDAFGTHGLKFVQSLLSLNYNDRRPKELLEHLFYHRYFANLNVGKRSVPKTQTLVAWDGEFVCSDFLELEKEIDIKILTTVDHKDIAGTQFIVEANKWKESGQYDEKRLQSYLNFFAKSAFGTFKPVTISISNSQKTITVTQYDEKKSYIMSTYIDELIAKVKEENARRK